MTKIIQEYSRWINYELYNYCKSCRIRALKPIVICPKCNGRMRKKPMNNKYRKLFPVKRY